MHGHSRRIVREGAEADADGDLLFVGEGAGGVNGISGNA